MVKLLNTTNVSLGRLEKLAGQNFIEVPAIGDGNCASNAFALGLIDLIQRDALRFEDKAKQQRLLAALANNVVTLKQRHQLYVGIPGQIMGNSYSDLAEDLENFINLVERKPNFQAVIDYIKNNSDGRLKVAALHVGLAPALREIGAELHLSTMQNITDELRAEDLKLMSDGEYAGFDILAPLAQDFFHVNFTAFMKANANQPQASRLIDDAPDIHLYQTGAHWNYLLPVKQEDGLKQVLVAPANVNAMSEVIDETQTQIDYVGYQAKQFAKNSKLISAALPEVAQTVSAASENLLSNTLQDANDEAVQAARTKLSVEHHAHSDSILDSVRKKLKIKENINSLGVISFKGSVGEMQKALLLGDVRPLPSEKVSDDEHLARALQNAEVLSFLCSHYTALSKVARPANNKDELDISADLPNSPKLK
tara:strand:+ start:2777 stop:4048 length:1272 start_codon:yes stop_codon:yes gene_type:complete